MTNKILIGGLVAIAFVAGSMMTITADAKQEDNTTFFGLLMELETQIISMQTQIQQLDLFGEKGETGDKGDTSSQGPAGPQGEAGDLSEAKAFHFQRSNIGSPSEGFPLFGKTFNLSKDSPTLIQVDVVAKNNGAAGQFFDVHLLVDNVVVAKGFQTDPDGIWLDVGMNWAGVLEAGSHNVLVEMGSDFTGPVCNQDPQYCNLSILTVG